MENRIENENNITNNVKHKIRPIKQQMFFAIDTRFQKGRDKYQDKKNKSNIQKDIVYSRTEHIRLKDVACMFSTFIKKEMPEVYRVNLNEIKPKHIEKFLEFKALTCNQNSLNSYKDSICKIARCCQAVYKSELLWNYAVVPISHQSQDKLRDITITKRALWAAIKTMRPDSGGYRGSILMGILDTRADEVVQIQVQDINIENLKVTILHGKGDKERVVDITEQQAKFIKPFITGKKPEAFVVGVTADTVDKAIIRGFERVDKQYGTNIAEQLKAHKTSGHAVRKMGATDYFHKKTDEHTKELIKNKLKEFIGFK